MLSMNPKPAALRKYYSRPAPLRSSREDASLGSSAKTKVYETASKVAEGAASPGVSGASLSIDVLLGIPAGKVLSATFPQILKGIHDRAQVEVRERPEIGSIRITVHRQAPVSFNPENRGEGAPPSLPPRGQHGTILVYPFAESAVELVSRRDFTVSVLESYTGLGIDAIDTDDEEAISSLVGRLHGAGHIRIGFLSWAYPVGGHWVERRYNGFARGLRARGLTVNREWVLNAGDTEAKLDTAQVADTAARLVKESGVTAWVCAADHQAYSLMESLQTMGIRVPEDCSVTGFDGLEAPGGLARVSSASVAHEHIGSSAVTRMINRIMYPSSPTRKIFVGAQPVPGETIIPPRQR
jgi:LacI family transcriptional regulator